MSHAATFVCDSSARKWLRHSHRAGTVGSQGCEHDNDLHACPEQTGRGSKESAGLKSENAVSRSPREITAYAKVLLRVRFAFARGRSVLCWLNEGSASAVASA